MTLNKTKKRETKSNKWLKNRGIPPDETETKKEIHSRILQNKDEDNSNTVH